MTDEQKRPSSTSISEPVPPHVPAPSTSAPSPQRLLSVAKRQTGITILAFLYGFDGAILLIVGVASLFGLMFGFIYNEGFSIATGVLIYLLDFSILIPVIYQRSDWLFFDYRLFPFLVFSLMILVALLLFVITFGLWNLKKWAWSIAVIYAVIDLIRFPVGTLISVLGLWYLFKPEVKAAFKQG